MLASKLVEYSTTPFFVIKSTQFDMKMQSRGYEAEETECYR